MAELGAERGIPVLVRERADDDERELGVPAHIVNAELEAGDIVLQRSTPVTDDDVITDLFDRTLVMFGPITTEALELIASRRTDWTPQDCRAASTSTGAPTRRTGSTGVAGPGPVQLVRAQLDLYPNAYCFHGARRPRILRARVTDETYGGTPGRIFIRDGSGVVIMAGADARRGRNPGLVIERVRLDDGTEPDGTEYVTHGRVPELVPGGPP